MAENEQKISIESLIEKTNFAIIEKEKEEKFLVLNGFNQEEYPIKIKIGVENKFNISCADENSKNVTDYNEKKINEENLKSLEGEIYQYNKIVLTKLIKEFKVVHSEDDKVNKASTHVRFDIDNEDNLFNKKKQVKELVDKFINSDQEDENELKKIFEKFWNKDYISSMQQGANAENIYKEYKIEKLQDNISTIINTKVEDNNFNETIKKIKQFNRMKNSAMELYYSYHIRDEKKAIPNFNRVANGIKIFDLLLGKEYFQNLEIINNKTKIDKIIEGFGLDKYEKIKIGGNDIETIPKYYVIDQLFNLFDKIKPNDIEKKYKYGNKDFKNTDDQKKIYKKVLEIINWTSINYFEDIVNDLKNNKNIIYYGAPGTGKTFKALKTIQYLTGGNKKLFEVIQFHPSYDYEDFIEGIKPMGIEDGQVNFELVTGKFKKICIEAFNNSDKTYYLILDEINRANLSRVFGELMYCLEYRYKHNEEKQSLSPWVSSKYSGVIQKMLGKDNVDYEKEKFTDIVFNDKENAHNFCIPENVIVIGTMNTADKSIDSFDLALRRRFIWKEFKFDYNVINNQLDKEKIIENIDSYVEYAKKINTLITSNKDNGLGLTSDYKIGHSYFLNVKANADGKIIGDDKVKELENNYLKPLLKEYCRAFIPEKEIDKKLDDLFTEARKEL